MNLRETAHAHLRNVSANRLAGGKYLAVVLTAASLLTFDTSTVSAHSYKLGDLAVGHIWAPEPVEGSRGVPVYAGVLNQSDQPITLVGATTSVATHVRIRKTKDGSVQWPDGIEFKPGSPFALAPWREHLWVSGLNNPLEEGDSFELTLEFGKAGTLDVVVVIESEAGH